jgi:hypothetical protein
MPASSWGPVRVCIAAQEARGDDLLLPMYTELGNRFHLEGKPRERAATEEALATAGLATGLADAADGEAFDKAIEGSHHLGTDQVGYEVGTPVVSVEGVAFFGPVVSPACREKLPLSCGTVCSAWPGPTVSSS